MLNLVAARYYFRKTMPANRLGQAGITHGLLRFASQPDPGQPAASPKPSLWKRFFRGLFKLIKWPFSQLAKLFGWGSANPQPLPPTPKTNPVIPKAENSSASPSLQEKPQKTEGQPQPSTKLIEPTKPSQTKPPEPSVPSQAKSSEAPQVSQQVSTLPKKDSSPPPKKPEPPPIARPSQTLRAPVRPSQSEKSTQRVLAPLVSPEIEQSLLYKVAVHELGHALVGRAAGFELKRIQINPEQPLQNSFARMDKRSLVGKTLDQALCMDLLMLTGSYASQFLFVNPERLTDIRQDPQNAFIFDIQYALDHLRRLKQQFLPYLQNKSLKAWLQTQPLDNVSYSQVFDLAPVQAATQCGIQMLRLIEPITMQRMALHLMQQPAIVGNDNIDAFFACYLSNQTLQSMQRIAKSFLDSPLRD